MLFINPEGTFKYEKDTEIQLFEKFSFQIWKWLKYKLRRNSVVDIAKIQTMEIFICCDEKLLK